MRRYSLQTWESMRSEKCWHPNRQMKFPVLQFHNTASCLNRSGGWVSKHQYFSWALGRGSYIKDHRQHDGRAVWKLTYELMPHQISTVSQSHVERWETLWHGNECNCACNKAFCRSFNVATTEDGEQMNDLRESSACISLATKLQFGSTSPQLQRSITVSKLLHVFKRLVQSLIFHHCAISTFLDRRWLVRTILCSVLQFLYLASWLISPYVNTHTEMFSFT